MTREKDIKRDLPDKKDGEKGKICLGPLVYLPSQKVKESAGGTGGRASGFFWWGLIGGVERGPNP